MKEIIEIFKACLTPTIAIITTYIAYQQWKTNRIKLRMDLYEKRLRIYKEVHKLLAIVIRNAKIEQNEFNDFIVNTSEADFLFDTEVTDFISEIYKHALHLQRWIAEYRDYTEPPKEGYNHKEVSDGEHSELQWLTNQFEPAKKVFKKYINLKQN